MVTWPHAPEQIMVVGEYLIEKILYLMVARKGRGKDKGRTSKRMPPVTFVFHLWLTSLSLQNIPK